ncbi:MAG: hypothetical protein AB7Q45_22975, partial [Planctomycetaceae bacterium]
ELLVFTHSPPSAPLTRFLTDEKPVELPLFTSTTGFDLIHIETLDKRENPRLIGFSAALAPMPTLTVSAERTFQGLIAGPVAHSLKKAVASRFS